MDSGNRRSGISCKDSWLLNMKNDLAFCQSWLILTWSQHYELDKWGRYKRFWDTFTFNLFGQQRISRSVLTIPPLRGEKQCTDVYIRLTKLHSARRQLVPAAIDWADEGKWRRCQFVSSRLMQAAVTCKFILIYSAPVTVLKLFTFRVYICVHTLLCVCVRTCACVPQHKRQTWISLLIALQPTH